MGNTRAQCEEWPFFNPPSGAVPQSNPKVGSRIVSQKALEKVGDGLEGRLSDCRFRHQSHKFVHCTTALRCHIKIQPRSAPVIPGFVCSKTIAAC
jgi:hypothetical protein